MQSTVQDFWLNDINRCLVKDHVVYVNHPKCASTYYTNLLTNNGWHVLAYKDIDWFKHDVFGFFMDPLVKHAKAITEDLISRHPDQVDKILGMGSTFFQDLGLFGWHSMPLWLRFGRHVDHITWIPLDAEESSDNLLAKYLEHHGLTVNFAPTVAHRSDAQKLQIFSQVRSLIGSGSAIIWQVLARDLDLYNHIRCQMNCYETQWLSMYGYRPGSSETK